MESRSENYTRLRDGRDEVPEHFAAFSLSDSNGVTRAIARQNYASPGTLVSVKPSERAAPWHGWKNSEGYVFYEVRRSIDHSEVENFTSPSSGKYIGEPLNKLSEGVTPSVYLEIKFKSK